MNPLPGHAVTTPYGVPGRWMAGYHTGEDRSTHGEEGVLVRAARGGTVVSCTNVWGSSYGLHVVIVGRAGRIRMGYCHLAKIYVRAGDLVTVGQVLGEAGSTGRSTGIHLHYEERRSPWRYGDCRRPRFSSRGAQ